MSLKNKFIAFAITVAAAGVLFVASEVLGQKLSVIASAVWGS